MAKRKTKRRKSTRRKATRKTTARRKKASRKQLAALRKARSVLKMKRLGIVKRKKRQYNYPAFSF